MVCALKINREVFYKNSWQSTVAVFLPLAGLLFKTILFYAYYYGCNYYEIDVINGLRQALPTAFIWLAVLVFYSSFALLSDKKQNRAKYLLLLDITYTVLCLIYICYMRYFNDVPTLRIAGIINLSNDDMPTSPQNIVIPLMLSDVLFFLDFFALAAINWTRVDLKILRGQPIVPDSTPAKTHHEVCRAKSLKSGRRFSFVAVVALSLICISSVAIGGSVGSSFYKESIGSPLAKTRLTALSPLGYFTGDIYKTIYRAQRGRRAPLSAERTAEVAAFFEHNSADYVANEYFGAAAGKNVLFIQVESLEGFVLGRSVEGQEITPNLNRLLSQSWCFSDIKDLVTCGNSSDADLIYDTSMYPASNESAFNFYFDNTYNSLPRILGADGYSSAYFNSAGNSIWDYNAMCEIGLQYEYSSFSFDLSDRVNTYLSDEAHLSQTLSHMLNLGYADAGAKWYARTVLCSSHTPFIMPTDKRGLKLVSGLENTVMGDYLQAIHYTDECIGRFLEKAREVGILDNTIVAIIGDHRGIHKYYPFSINSMDDDLYQNWMGKNFDGYLSLLVYDASMADGEGKRFEGPYSQVDVMPTLLYLLGVQHDRYKHTAMGKSMLLGARTVIDNNGTVYGKATPEDAAHIRGAYSIAQSIYESDYFNGRLS